MFHWFNNTIILQLQIICIDVQGVFHIVKSADRINI